MAEHSTVSRGGLRTLGHSDRDLADADVIAQEPVTHLDLRGAAGPEHAGPPAVLASGVTSFPGRAGSPSW